MCQGSHIGLPLHTSPSHRHAPPAPVGATLRGRPHIATPPAAPVGATLRGPPGVALAPRRPRTKGQQVAIQQAPMLYWIVGITRSLADAQWNCAVVSLDSLCLAVSRFSARI